MKGGLLEVGLQVLACHGFLIDPFQLHLRLQQKHGNLVKRFLIERVKVQFLLKRGKGLLELSQANMGFPDVAVDSRKFGILRKQNLEFVDGLLVTSPSQIDTP